MCVVGQRLWTKQNTAAKKLQHDMLMTLADEEALKDIKHVHKYVAETNKKIAATRANIANVNGIGFDTKGDLIAYLESEDVKLA